MSSYEILVSIVIIVIAIYGTQEETDLLLCFLEAHQRRKSHMIGCPALDHLHFRYASRHANDFPVHVHWWQDAVCKVTVRR